MTCQVIKKAPTPKERRLGKWAGGHINTEGDAGAGRLLQASDGQGVAPSGELEHVAGEHEVAAYARGMHARLVRPDLRPRDWRVQVSREQSQMRQCHSTLEACSKIKITLTVIP